MTEEGNNCVIILLIKFTSSEITVGRADIEHINTDEASFAKQQIQGVCAKEKALLGVKRKSPGRNDIELRLDPGKAGLQKNKQRVGGSSKGMGSTKTEQT